ncbi:MAG: hypothetical protein QOD03_1199 [Verrucomicrobiota bacterium]|jgi:hypothetical protein
MSNLIAAIKNSQAFSENNLEDVQSLLPRFVRAKWITGKNGVWPEEVQLTYTGLGKKGMLRIAEITKPLAPEYFGLPKQKPSAWTITKAVIRFEIACAPLYPARLSDREKSALVALAVALDRQQPETLSNG